MDVSNPRRVLAVSLASQADQLSRVIKDLTGRAPSPAAGSLAGTTHELALDTAYYRATVPVWLDLVAEPAAWAESFLSDEAAEVLAVLGALVVVFALPGRDAGPAPELPSLIRHLGRVVHDGLGGWEWDGVRLAVGVGAADADADEWDELCAEAGLEFVHVNTTNHEPGLNQFGERTGLARVKEALEANEWEQADGDALSDVGDPAAGADDADADLDPETLAFGFDKADFDGLKRAIWTAGRDEDEDEPRAETEGETPPHGQPSSGERPGQDDPGPDDVARLEQMMHKLQAARDTGAGLGDAQRRKMAARAVADVMRDL